MAPPLKLFFDAACVRAVGATFAEVNPPFPLARFVAEATDGLDALELLGRGAHIADALARALPADRAEALAIVVASLDVPLALPAGGAMAPFAYLPHTTFIGAYGLAHPEAALDAQHAVTRRFSAEFCIRPYIEHHWETTFARLRLWVTDPDAHVRRLVSEGTRPRLPWAGRLRALQADPSPMLPLLAQLRDDPSEYVRRSVANHLNDIGKDHPALLVRIATEWSVDAPPTRAALLRHALRDRVKKGDRAAIAVLGAGGGTFDVRADLPATAYVGGRLPVVVHVTNTGAAAARAVVDVAVTFPGKSAAGRRKVFKLATVDLAAGASSTHRTSISLAHHTTRAAMPGPHTVDVQVDGDPRRAGVVNVEPAAK